MRLVDGQAVQVELGLHRPVAAAQLADDVGAEPSADERLLVLELLSGVPRLRRGLVAVLRRRQHVALVGQRVARHGRGRARVDARRVRRPAASARRRTPARDRCRRPRAWRRRSRASRRFGLRAPGRGACSVLRGPSASVAAAGAGLRPAALEQRLQVGQFGHAGSRPSCRFAMRQCAFEIRLGVERRHAAGAGRRHRLAIDVVGDVARGEHARHRGRRRVAFAAALDLDVAAGHVELAFEDLRVRRVADRDEHAVHGEVLRRAGLHVLEAHAGDARCRRPALRRACDSTARACCRRPSVLAIRRSMRIASARNLSRR